MKKLCLLAWCFLMLSSAPARAVPGAVSFTGRLTTSQGPVNGSVDLTFELFDVPTGGTHVWTETQNGVGAENGLVFVELGSRTTLDESILAGGKLYLQVTVGTEALTPRLPIGSVPYAVRSTAAAAADTLGGMIKPADVVTGVTGNAGVSAVKNGNSVAVGLVTTGCTNGQVYKYNGSTFACAADGDTTYTAGVGLSLSGTAFSLNTAGCAAGQVYKYNGSTFACAADNNTTYTAGTGIAVNGTTVSLITTGCASGQVYAFNGTNFACTVNDPYTAGTGIAIAAGRVSLSTTGCAAGSQWQYNGTTFQCVPAYSDADAVGAVAAQTVTHVYGFSASHFKIGNLSGGTLSCVLPAANCSAPAGQTSSVYLPLQIPVPATLTGFSCLLTDNDATTDITLRVFNGSLPSASATSTGAVIGPRTISIPGLNLAVGSTSRGPTVEIDMVSTAGQPAMFLFECNVTYTTNGL